MPDLERPRPERTRPERTRPERPCLETPRLERPRLDAAQGVRLSSPSYRQEFRERRWTVAGRDCWKLERQQHFQEPRNESWQAFSRGDWDEALRLIEQGREDLMKLAQDSDAHRSHFFRVRVVEQPLTSYLQWELTTLRLRAELMGRIRVWAPEEPPEPSSLSGLPEPSGPLGPLGPLEVSGSSRLSELDRLEESGPLPEIVVMGGHTLYQVLYDDNGIGDGALRFTDPEAIAQWEKFIQVLYHEAEDLRSFVDREVTPATSARSI
ncbi:DUF6879 family protein [Streptomyces sp. NPDC048506]|uniref:DUF6879 family protein n=1 Tax=Streptomyces sp. NPDC048506 TaxID=3155028 RepID=UPI003444FE8A